MGQQVWGALREGGGSCLSAEAMGGGEEPPHQRRLERGRPLAGGVANGQGARLTVGGGRGQPPAEGA